jgi:uncharacterized protein (TIGR03437 family)
MLLRWWIFGGMAIISPAQTLTTLASFNGTDGAEPESSLVQGTDGSFYGTTPLTIFKITPGGALTTLYGSGGSYAGLTQATDGNFYGTASEGFGTVFKITPGGALTALYSFTGGTDGSDPQTGLIQAADGNFYGTTSRGGAFSGYGTIFKITPGGTLTTLYSFTGGDGETPGALFQATDGNFYGTTNLGGANDHGTVFKIAPGGAFTTLYSFTDGADGGEPSAGLIQATDGNFYGTTGAGGANDDGTVFKITPGGMLVTLHSFTGGRTDGYEVVAGLIQATDGNFYGTTELGGANDDGTIFKITPGGVLTILHSFGSTEGYEPEAGLVEGTDGNLYGTTFGGGANGDGTVFVLETMLPTSSSSSTPAITLVQNAEGGASTIAPNTWVTLKGSNLAPAGDSRIWQASDFANNELPTQLDGVSVKLNGENAYVYYISPTQINILTPPDMATGTVQVQAATSAGTSASFAAQAQAESPSFFIFGGGPYVVATHGDGSLIGPASLYPGLTTPAQPGETIVLYANGFGPTSTPVVSGSETQSGSLNPLPVVTIGVNPATVQFAGLISPGLFQFNVVVPASTPAGDNALTATYSGLSTQSGVLVTVGP